MTARPFASLLLAALLALPAGLAGQDARPSGAAVVAGAVKAAEDLIRVLDEVQRRRLLLRFDDLEQRRRWSNLPVGIFERKGVRWGDLDATQRSRVLALIKVTLSPRGYQQILDNVGGDEALRKSSRRGGRVAFGRDEFFLSILGTPSRSEAWIWQFGGHHLAINATLARDKITLAPSLTGGQPMRYEAEGRKVHLLKDEVAAAHRLLDALSADQRSKAIRGPRHADMIFGPGREGAQPKDDGLRARELSAKQRRLLLALIEQRVGLLNVTHAAQAMAAIKAGLDDTWFAWYGPTEPGEPATYRIQGPRLLMEYAPQRMGGDPTQHVHAMWRDPANDYGSAFLKPRRRAY